MDPIDLKKNYAEGNVFDPVRYNQDQTAVETAVNKITQSTTDGDSGAHHIRSAGIPGILAGAASYVWNQLKALKDYIDAVAAGFVMGQLPDNSVGPAKLTFDPATQTELDAHSADYIRQPGYAATSGTSTAYTADLTPNLSAYANGVGITIVPHVDCGASPTLAIDGLSAIPLKKQSGEAYGAGELKANTPYSFKYVGGSFFADSAGGLDDFFGDGSDGTIPDLVACTTAPNGGTVANLWDMNAGTTFTTGTLSSASDQVVFSIDFGSPQYQNSIRFWQASISTGVNRNLSFDWSDDGVNWTSANTVAVSTTPSNLNISGGGVVHRYWRVVLKSGGSNCTVSIQGITLNYFNTDAQTTHIWHIIYPVTAQSGIAIKQFTNLTLPAGYEITTDNPCRGLVCYVNGDMVHHGITDMSQKAGLAPNGNIIPMVLTKKNSGGTATIDKYLKLTTVLELLKGGSGGNGGYGGGYSGSTGRQASAGIGGAGRQNLGGFGGGGSGGSANYSSSPSSGGIGGSIIYAELGNGTTNNVNVSGDVNSNGINSSNGGGGTGSGRLGPSSKSGFGGTCLGGGGGGSGAVNALGNTNNGSNGQYAGGFVLFIVKGNVSGSGSIKCNGGNGGNGSNANGADFAGGGGGGGGSGGGVIAIFHKGTYTAISTLQVNGGTGGTGGTGAGTGEAGGSGTSGSIGTIHIQQIA